MSPVVVAVTLVGLARLAELLLAARNTRRLLAKGGVEHGRAHYVLFVLLHGGWLAGLLWTVPPDRWPDPWLTGLFVLLQAARVWIIATLGERWTTRIVVLPDAPLVRSGPYRWLRHPNYAVVVLEIALLPLAFGAVGLAVAFSILNGLLLRHRIGVEDRALGRARGLADAA
ncbi:isoprenylcysteine carboxyl methyltransferase family protein [Marinivivus vitaminiproducens]|uniref:isoprenylcysteine carboxyl methyltransferase family protein n=1 Tax=Marinivivus vitaminiproducens TaxID=3035935 RepID=UPI0027A71277|nr:isoprenylcysteine carboxylmethyltransferase family protein [Geminicoccaceae bacterium SCSIO 64248]